MVKCRFCGGEIVKGKKNFSVTRGGYSVMIRDVQTDICSQRGETYYDAEQKRAIEEILKTIDNQVKKLQAPVVSMKFKA